MAGEARISLQIVGQEDDGGDVRFNHFIKQLEVFKNALSNTARVVSGKTSRDKERVYFKVVNLEHNSPALIELEAVSPKNVINDPESVVKKFHDSIDEIERGVAPPGFDYEAFHAFQQLPVLHSKKHVADVMIGRNGHKKSLAQLSQKIDAILGPDEFEYGSVTGMFDHINLHANQNVFTIYPTSDWPKLKCSFPLALKGHAVGAVGKYVTVYGQLKFKPQLKDGRPYELKAEEIEVHEPEENLPTLASLAGAAPNATKKMSEDFIREIRGEW